MGAFLIIRIDLPPLAIRIAPENCRYHAVSKGLRTIPMAPHDSVAHGVGVPRNHTTHELSIRDGTAANQF
jgi:hypothetical protein